MHKLQDAFAIPTDQIEDIRKAARDGLITLGAPPEFASQSADMAVHMTQEALRATERVAETIHDGAVLMSAATCAFSILHQRLAFLEGATREFVGNEEGVNSKTMMVEVR